MQLLLAAVILAQAGFAPPVRDPAFAADGRLAVAIEGDIWTRDAGGGNWRRLTSGPAWDRHPAWSPDGRSIVFSSDRSGNPDLWRVVLGAAPGTAPERLTTDPDADVEPVVGRDGTIVFVRGRGAAARLWRRAADGDERRLTRNESPERHPAIAPAGDRVAYVQLSDAGRRLRIRSLTAEADTVVVSDRAAEHPTWSPDGRRLAFSSATPRPGIYVAPTDGRYVNFAAPRRGEPAWEPNGRSILVAERAADEVGYNGDPDRVPDRSATESLASTEAGLVTIAAPTAPDEATSVVPVRIAVERASRNLEAFDRVWDRIDRVYFSDASAAERHARWRAVRETFRPRAQAARDDAELERVLHAMIGERPPLRQEAVGRAAVSSAHPVATEAGLEIIRKGGNVVDAAAAVSFALGVVEPDASGIGGYGEMLVHMKGMEKPALIEFMARVPEEASLSNAALLEDGRYPSDGPVLAMVPGTVAGMHTAWRRYGSGKVTWADIVAPAVRAARDGYVVSDGLATTLVREREGFAKYESSRALFFRNGRPLAAGDTIRNPDLAWTLEQIARNGADGFYRGAVAQRMVADLRGKGNAIRLTDLARYFAADREPVASTYRDHTVYSGAPPASGGSTLVAQLNLLEQFASPKPYVEDAATLHAMLSAWALVPSGRGRMGDPSLWPVSTEAFTSKDTARVRWKCYSPSRIVSAAALANAASCDSARAAPSGDAPEAASLSELCTEENHAAGAVCRANGTTAFTVADADGNVVSVTQTLGTWGGNFYVSPGLGFLYNDKLTSYGTDPNGYGARLPYARHGSTLAPTIVFSGAGSARRPILAVGAAGNAWITSAVYQTLVGVVDFGLSPQRALELPRFLPSGRGGGPGGAREMSVDVEDGFHPDVVARLRAMGYRLNAISTKGELRMGYGAAVVIGDGVVRAGADPRRSGAAGAVPK